MQEHHHRCYRRGRKLSAGRTYAEDQLNFVVIADHIGSEDFLLACKLLRPYNVLVDLTAMKVTIRDLKMPRVFKAVHLVSNQEPSFVVSAEEVTLGLFERKVVRAKVITQQSKEFLFRNVMVVQLGAYFRRYTNLRGRKRCSFLTAKKPNCQRKGKNKGTKCSWKSGAH